MAAGGRVWQRWRTGGQRQLVAWVWLLGLVAVMGLAQALLWWPPPAAALLIRLALALAVSGLLLAGCLRLATWLRFDLNWPAERANAAALGMLAVGGLAVMAAGGPVVTAVVGRLAGAAIAVGALLAAAGMVVVLTLVSSDLSHLLADDADDVATPAGDADDLAAGEHHLADVAATPVPEADEAVVASRASGESGLNREAQSTLQLEPVAGVGSSAPPAPPGPWRWLDSRWTLAVLVVLVLVAGFLVIQRLRLLDLVLSEPGPGSPPAGVASSAPGQVAVAPPLVDLAPGEVRTLIGAGGTTTQPLSDPRGLAMGPGGQLYIVETGARQVVEVNAGGAVVRRWGGAGQGAGQFEEPVAVAVDASGGIHVLDAQRNSVQVFDSDGRIRRSYGEDLGLYRPRGLARGKDGRFYVADTGRNRVLALSDSGGQADVIPPNFDAKPPPIDQPTMAVAVDTVLYVAEPTRGRLLRLANDGAPVGPPWTLTTTDTLVSARLSAGPTGEAIVAEVGARRVLIVCPGGNRVLAWKMPDGTAEPRAAVLGPDVTLYVVEAEGRLLATRLSQRC